MFRVAIAAAMLSTTAPLAAALPAGFAAEADAYLARAYPADRPGAVIVVTEKGKTAYRAAFGLADMETKAKVTPRTVFRYGSISKQFAAATLMKYVERGAISLDDPLGKHLPDYPQPGAAATVRQLLNHTSGIASYTAIPGWMEQHAAKPLTTTEMIATFKDQPMDFAPGTSWRYNNSGYVLVGALIEKLSGKPWEAAVADEILRPLRLSSVRHGAHEATIKAMAKGYGRRGEAVIPAPAIHMNITGPAGALVGTADDLARWADALHHGKVVSAESYRAMAAPTRLASGAEQPYGLAFELDDVRGAAQLGHSGRTMGFASDSIYLPSKELFITVMTNSDDPTAVPVTVTRRLAAMALGDPFPELEEQPLDPAAAAALAGEYQSADGARRVELADGKLWWAKAGSRPRPLRFAGNGRYFFGPEALDYIDFKPGADGRMTAEIHQRGAHEATVARWSAPIAASVVTLSTAELDRLAGRYETPMGPAVVARDGDRLTFALGDQPALPMSPQSATRFVLREVGATLEWVGDELVIRHNGRDVPAKRVR